MTESAISVEAAAVLDCAALVRQVADELATQVQGLERAVSAMFSGGWSGSAAAASDRA